MPGDGSPGVMRPQTIRNEPRHAAEGAYVQAVMTTAVLVSFDLIKHETTLFT